MFDEAHLKVIRLGLHSIENDSYIDGPWHPAFSELCYSKIYLKNAKKLLVTKGSYTLFVNPSAVSKMIGQRRENINELKNLGFDCVVKSESFA